MKIISRLPLLLALLGIAGYCVCSDSPNGHTVEVADAKIRLYRLNIDGCEGVTFQVPIGWNLSHWPDGGVAGGSCFRKEGERPVMIVVDRRDRPATEPEISQEVLLEETKARDQIEERKRLGDEEQIASKTQELNIRQSEIKIRTRPRHSRDIASVSCIAERRTADGRLVRIMHWFSPVRGTWLEAMIPATGFLVTVDGFSSDQDYTDEDIDAICNVVSSYRFQIVKKEKPNSEGSVSP